MKFQPIQVKPFLKVIFVFLLFAGNLSAQDSFPIIPDQLDDEQYYLRINSTEENIKIDGILDEPAWQTGKANGKFWQNFPGDSTHAQGQTEMYMTYDKNNLYIAVVCYSSGNDFVTGSLRRDYSFRGTDNIKVK